VALALLSAYRACDRASFARFAELGVLIALAALVRTEGLLLLLLLALPVAWRAGHGVRWPRLGVAAAACVVVLSPWLIRCWIAFDQPVLISTNSGDLIAGANCDATYAGPLMGGWAFGCLGDGAPGGNEAEVSKRLRDRGLDYAADHAGRLPVVVAARVLRPWGLFRPDEQIALRVAGEGQRRRVDWIGLACFWALVPLAIAGMLLLRRRGQPLFILAAPFVLVVVVSATGYGVLRFRTPADPALIALAAVALDALVGAHSRRRALI